MDEHDEMVAFNQEHTYQQKVQMILMMIGVPDHRKALKCDSGPCNDLIIALTCCNDDLVKFLKYMRA